MSINKDVLLNIRDLVIEFRVKGKKFRAVKETSFDIYNGEIFGLVGESGSGKTTIGRAIVGVQPLKDGAIYMNDNIVAGRPTSLYTLNKEISKKLDNMSYKMNVTTREIQARIDGLKTLYENFLKNPRVLTQEELEKFTRSSKLKFLKDIVLENLKYINTIIKNEDRMIKFVDNLHSYVPEVSKELEKSVLIKLKETKESILSIKENADEIYLKIKEISEYRETINNIDPEKLDSVMTNLLNMWKVITENHREFLSKLSWAKSLQFQLHALSSPLSRRQKYINYYNNLVYVNRNEFFEECKNQFEIMKSKGVSSSSDEYKKLEYFIRDFWSRKNLNVVASKEILKSLSENEIVDSKIESLVSKLKNTDFENSIRDLISDESNITNAKIAELKKELKYITKIIENNIVKDRELIENFNSWKGIEIPYSQEEIDSFVELAEFLELPSIDEIIKDSYLFKVQSKEQKRSNRKNIQMIFQDPGSSLNDRMAIEEIIAEGMENFPDLYKGQEAKELYVTEYNQANPNEKITFDEATPAAVKKHIILKLVNSVGLLPEHLSRYPHEFSGGQRQRVGIARSLAMRPKLIVADEPISALDVSIRAQVLNLFKKFQEELGLTYVFVAHDLSVVRHIADRIAVIYHGQIIEIAPAEELFKNPLHPYTRALLSAIPIPEPELAKETKLVVYNPEEEHKDYIFDLPYFKEITKDHFVWANKREIKEIKKLIKK
ncbi:oligopeptide ABC transporter ATP-binding protein OppF [Spiroplasma diminutum]|uniref:Oligopeptide ABC transporter ATP-binding protein n=1 Tax=Spiroplasma diminutum CUAS-1 TaxID=1276221 RepID=S5MK35_9MOLU|nr:oligopeptide ABC transporter ATP-binding protein OppF [Spiroplasma diminutum]AGR42330.1 oligopeptide ABC transporter ATP-binding protein [Spiroplasma diminutum CUAS-1]